jgi:Holliday junction resolvase RusA-like endonuclease
VIDITITIPIKPVPKGRAVPTTVKGRTFMRTPTRTHKFETQLALMAATKLPAKPFEGALRVDILAVVQRPKALLKVYKKTGKAKYPTRLMWCPKRPDADNYAKSVLDGLARHWHDDAQVTFLVVKKMYSELVGKPRIEIRIRTLEQAPVFATDERWIKVRELQRQIDELMEEIDG